MSFQFESGPETLITRQEATKLLNEAGFPISARTLASMGARGYGPPFRLWGTRVLYLASEVLDWAYQRLREPFADAEMFERPFPVILRRDFMGSTKYHSFGFWPGG